jgi:CRP-like cAMP-binding protein
VTRPRDVLRRVSYFASVPAAELDRLATKCTARSFAPGELLFQEGEPCRALFVIAEGLVELSQISVRGREQVFHTEGAGATLAEAPLFDGGGFIASAVALEPTRALLVDRADVVALCRRHPAVALAMLTAMARRVRHFADLVSDLAFRPVTERLARYLASAGEGAPASGARIDLGLTQSQLAARLGTVRELVARAFAELERNGVIARHRSRVTIRNPGRLMAMARGEKTSSRR